MRPELWASLAEMVGSIQPTDAAAELLRVDRVELDVPMEITFRGAGEGLVLLGSPPLWRWPTAFDRRPGRLRVVLRPEAPAVLPVEDAGGPA